MEAGGVGLTGLGGADAGGLGPPVGATTRSVPRSTEKNESSWQLLERFLAVPARERTEAAIKQPRAADSRTADSATALQPLRLFADRKHARVFDLSLNRNGIKLLLDSHGNTDAAQAVDLPHVIFNNAGNG